MITKLTKEQVDLMPIIRDKWIKKAITPTLRPTSVIQNNIKELYEMAGVKAVPVIVCTSLKDFENELKTFLESSVRSSVWSSVDSSVDSSVGSSVGPSVGSLVWSSVGSLVRSLVRLSVVSSVWSSVESLVWSLVRSSVRSSVEPSVRSLVWPSVVSLVGLYYWADDFAYYDFWKTIGVYTDKENIEKIEKYIDLLSDCSYGFVTDKIAIVLTKPVVHVDENWMLHNPEGKALVWSDGEGKYYLHGVEFDEDLFKRVTSGDMPFEDILAIEDIDQRTQAMRFGDPQAFLKHVNAKLLDTYQKKTIEGKEVNYVLWKVLKGEIFQTDAYFMMYNCPSTNKQYMSGVPKFNTVPEAMAWKQSDDFYVVTPEQWKQMVPLIHES